MYTFGVLYTHIYIHIHNFTFVTKFFCSLCCRGGARHWWWKWIPWILGLLSLVMFVWRSKLFLFSHSHNLGLLFIFGWDWLVTVFGWVFCCCYVCACAHTIRGGGVEYELWSWMDGYSYARFYGCELTVLLLLLLLLQGRKFGDERVDIQKWDLEQDVQTWQLLGCNMLWMRLTASCFVCFVFRRGSVKMIWWMGACM